MMPEHRMDTSSARLARFVRRERERRTHRSASPSQRLVTLALAGSRTFRFNPPLRTLVEPLLDLFVDFVLDLLALPDLFVDLLYDCVLDGLLDTSGSSSSLYAESVPTASAAAALQRSSVVVSELIVASVAVQERRAPTPHPRGRPRSRPRSRLGIRSPATPSAQRSRSGAPRPR